MNNFATLKAEIEESDKLHCFACHHILLNHKSRSEDTSGWNCDAPECACPFTIEDNTERRIENQAKEEAYRQAEKMVRDAIDKKIRSYEGYKLITERDNKIRVALAELKQNLGISDNTPLTVNGECQETSSLLGNKKSSNKALPEQSPDTKLKKGEGKQ